MSKLDQLIEQALSDQDKEMLRETRQLGWFALGASQFSGKLGWVTWVIMVVQIALFITAVWTGWHFFAASEPLTALKWGLPSATLVIVATILKTSLMPQMQADRILRELKRVELMIAQKAG
ncbi:hypothetical protein OEG84_09715 [Hoeflea sp. G2-23]|uniref:Holin-X, holin superfamily III n=1 Tax=Hoeflea algicola TaxID=2983763 RepID=A0ABT3Z8I5_9HYPH|nr:DUF6768 family protein [Hoeflea algicola]MCY0147978.1 hypothetical protein [Hoeflea algicola]